MSCHPEIHFLSTQRCKWRPTMQFFLSGRFLCFVQKAAWGGIKTTYLKQGTVDFSLLLGSFLFTNIASKYCTNILNMNVHTNIIRKYWTGCCFSTLRVRKQGWWRWWWSTRRRGGGANIGTLHRFWNKTSKRKMNHKIWAKNQQIQNGEEEGRMLGNPTGLTCNI